MNLKTTLYLLICVLFVLTLNFSSRAQDKAPELDQQLWEQAIELAQSISIIDAHTHDLFKPVSSRFPKQVDYEMIKKAGVTGLVHSYPLNTRKNEYPKQHVIDEIKKFQALVKPKTKQIFNAEGFKQSEKNKELAILLGIEYPHGMFEGKLESVKEYYDLGVRSIGLSNRGLDTIYTKSNDNHQLSKFGIDLINKLNEYGIACDLSHVPDDVRYLVAEVSEAPVYVSHANVREVVNANFNVSNKSLKSITDKGGVICLTFYSEYVSKECLAQKGQATSFADLPRAKAEEFIDHIDYFKNTVGIDYVSVGSDYGGSGRAAPKGLETIEDWPLIIYHMLKRNYSKAEIEKVMGLNFINYLKRVEKHSL